MHHTAIKTLLKPNQLKLCKYQKAHVLEPNKIYGSDETASDSCSSGVGEGAGNFLKEMVIQDVVDMVLLNGVYK